jgi:ribosome biogenesis protein SSF1/2
MLRADAPLCVLCCDLDESTLMPHLHLCLVQRVVLLSADPVTGLISLRHYTISTAPSGVKKSLKALVLGQDVPDMGSLQDVADLITKSGYGSVSC